jgi:microcystin-dependent protein
MKINKLKVLSVAICCAVTALWTEAQGMEERFDRMQQEIRSLNMTLADLTNSIPPIGATMEYSGTVPVPNNWLECNGQPVSRVNYAVLFANIGITYGGGDGINTFNLPDRRGRVAVGIGSDGTTGNGGCHVTNATAPNIALGGTFGEETHQLTINEMPSHKHNLTYANSNSSHDGFLPDTGMFRRSSSDAVSSTGGDQSHNNVQPSIFQRFYIRAK